MIYKYYESLLCFLILLFLFGCGVYESSPLIVSIRSNDAYSVKSLIESGEDVNALSLDLIEKQYWKITPLIRASFTGNIDIITMLLEAGADVNGIDEWGDTALMAASDTGNSTVAKLLIQYGANVNATKPDKTTALMIAARRGRLEVTNTLLDAGADVDIGLGGDTALSLAAWKGNAEIVEALVKKGATVDRVDLLKWAIENNHQNIKELFESEEVNRTNDMIIEEKRILLSDPNYRARNLNESCNSHSDCVGNLMCINNVCMNR